MKNYHITMIGADSSFLISSDNIFMSGTSKKYINFEYKHEITSCICLNLIDNIVIYNDDNDCFDTVFENGHFVVPFSEVL